MARKTALVVCPGRGTYTKEDLGYLARHHADKATLIAQMDTARDALGQQTLSALDGADRYSVATHTRGDNASALIHACAYADFLSIDRDRFDIVAVTGNSMGWYIALACAGSLDQMGGFTVVNTMGTLMQEAMIGGQVLYPFVDETWVEVPGKHAELLALTDDIPGLHVSIHLGGMIVFAGEDPALKALEDGLDPVQGRFPMRLANHAAFHTPLQAPVAERGQAALPRDLFNGPDIPLVDGRGQVWFPRSTDAGALRDYTLGHQVTEAYDFTAAIRSGIREFAPHCLIILGPGTTLIGATAQALIGESWFGLGSKTDFAARQSDDPVVLAMGSDDLRSRVAA